MKDHETKQDLLQPGGQAVEESGCNWRRLVQGCGLAEPQEVQRVATTAEIGGVTCDHVFHCASSLQPSKVH